MDFISFLYLFRASHGRLTSWPAAQHSTAQHTSVTLPGYFVKASNTHLPCHTSSHLVLSWFHCRSSLITHQSAPLVCLTPENTRSPTCWFGHQGSSRLLCCLLQDASVHFVYFRLAFYGTEDAQALQSKQSGENHHPIFECFFVFLSFFFLWTDHEKNHFFNTLLI